MAAQNSRFVVVHSLCSFDLFFEINFPFHSLAQPLYPFILKVAIVLTSPSLPVPIPPALSHQMKLFTCPFPTSHFLVALFKHLTWLPATHITNSPLLALKLMHCVTTGHNPDALIAIPSCLGPDIHTFPSCLLSMGRELRECTYLVIQVECHTSRWLSPSLPYLLFECPGKPWCERCGCGFRKS